MYTLLELQSKTFGELRKIGDELNVLPAGDRRYRETWIEAIAGVNPPLLQLLEVSPGSEVEQVQPIIETAETSIGVEVEPVQEAPLESKFGRIVYPRPAQGAITQEAENSPAVEVDRVQEPIKHRFLLYLKDGENILWYDGKDFVCEKWNAKTYCSRGIGVAKYQLHSHPEVKRVFCSIGNTLQVAENSPSVEADPVLEPISQVTKTSPGVEVEQAQEAIEVQAQEPYPRNARRDCPRCVGIQSLYWTRNFCMEQWVIRCLYCDYERPKNPRFAHLEPPVYGPEEYPSEAFFRASAFQAAPPPYSAPGDYCCTWAPIVEADPLAEPIAEAAENSPAASVDPFEPKCSECFDGGFIEDEFGRVRVCCCNNKPKLSRPKTQSAIAPAAETSPGVESDLNPILTRIRLSDRFVARYAPPQAQQLCYQVADKYDADADGQLSLLSEVILEQPEPPDPDDFESLDDFRQEIALWDSENPEPLAVSMDSMCEWAPCPDEWYEPKAEFLPLKASSMIELPEKSEVMELLDVSDSSDTLDFSIPTFDRWGDRSDRSDEPPDTGIFARLPKPKPPNFPPRASQPQVGHKLNTSSEQPGIPKLSRNYPETIPKLFRVAAGTSTQPARSPPGGDA